MSTSLKVLLDRVARCELCVPHLPLGPRPLVKIHSSVRLLIIGQAPGRLAHESQTPWNDPSGDRLRAWLGVDRSVFDEAPEIGLMPMGFCFPGSGKSGDLAPRAECAPAWHEDLLRQMPELQTTLLIGKYALDRYLPGPARRSVTAAVSGWRETFPERLAMPHPSPRNNRWLRNNPWFEQDVLPSLQAQVTSLLEHKAGEA